MRRMAVQLLKTSRFFTSSAFSWMNLRRASTSSLSAWEDLFGGGAIFKRYGEENSTDGLEKAPPSLSLRRVARPCPLSMFDASFRASHSA